MPFFLMLVHLFPSRKNLTHSKWGYKLERVTVIFALAPMSMFMLDAMSPWEFRVKQLLPFACNFPYHAMTIPVDVLSVHSGCLCFSAVLFRLDAFGKLC